MYVRSRARSMREMWGRGGCDMHVCVCVCVCVFACDQRWEACVEVELGIELVKNQGIDDES